MIAEAVAWGDLLQVVYVSLIAGVGITLIWSVGIVGVAKWDAHRQAGDTGGAAGYAALAVLAGLAVVAAIVEAIIIMTTK